MITAHVREYVRKACQAPANAFSPQFFEQHIDVVAGIGMFLAKRLGADKEIVELAAYLHDLSAIRDIKALPQHPQLSADLAMEYLEHNGYPHDRILQVRQCILTHSSPLTPGTGNLEEICLSNADAISQIVRPSFWLYYAFGVRGFAFKEGYDWMRNRVEMHWTAMIPEARELITEEYRLAKKILGY